MGCDCGTFGRGLECGVADLLGIFLVVFELGREKSFNEDGSEKDGSKRGSDVGQTQDCKRVPHASVGSGRGKPIFCRWPRPRRRLPESYKRARSACDMAREP